MEVPFIKNTNSIVRHIKEADPKQIDWRDVKPFQATLYLKAVKNKHIEKRKKLYVVLEDDFHRTYYMYPREFKKLISYVKERNYDSSYIHGTWKFVKNHGRYGVEFVA